MSGLTISEINRCYETLKEHWGEQNISVKVLGESLERIHKIQEELVEFKKQPTKPALQLKIQLLEGELDTKTEFCRMICKKNSELFCKDIFSDRRPDIKDLHLVNFINQ